MLADLHVYKDHIDSLKQLDSIVPFAFPYLEIDPSIKNIEEFKFNHLKLIGYNSHKKIEMKMSV
jgi:thymidylate synthase